MNLQDLADKKLELDALMKQYGEAAIKEELKEFFALHQEVISLAWEQYTPYFNDGEPCHFRVGSVELKLSDLTNVDSSWIEEYDEYPEDAEPLQSYYLNSSPLKTDVEALDRRLSANKITMLAAFGDHTRVIATPTKITIEDYSDHD